MIHHQRFINATGFTLAFATLCLAFGTCVSGCTVIEKAFTRVKGQNETVTRVKTDSLVSTTRDSSAYSQRDIKVTGGFTVEFDTGCKENKLIYHPGTGKVEATGNVRSARVLFTREESAKDTTRVKSTTDANVSRDNKTREKVKTITINKTKTVTRVPWWIYAVLGVGFVYAAYRFYKRLNPLL